MCGFCLIYVYSVNISVNPYRQRSRCPRLETLYHMNFCSLPHDEVIGVSPQILNICLNVVSSVLSHRDFLILYTLSIMIFPIDAYSHCSNVCLVNQPTLLNSFSINIILMTLHDYSSSLLFNLLILFVTHHILKHSYKCYNPFLNFYCNFYRTRDFQTQSLSISPFGSNMVSLKYSNMFTRQRILIQILHPVYCF